MMILAARLAVLPSTPSLGLTVRTPLMSLIDRPKRCHNLSFYNRLGLPGPNRPGLKKIAV